MPNKFLRAVYFALLVALPAVLFFSYHPIISLGANSSMNFELSLPLIWIILFDLISLINFAILFRRHKNSDARHKLEKARGGKKGFKDFCEGVRLGPAPRSGPSKKLLKSFILLSFPVYVSASIFWSSNPLRAILTVGILWLVIFAIFAIIRLSPLLEPPSRLKIWAVGVFFVSTAVVCLFCFIQSLLDSCGLSRETTLLCAGCTYRSFGFPHPNGFAIEPQFMGNLLLAPTLLALYLLCQTASKTPSHSNKTEQNLKTEHAEPEQCRSASVAEIAQATEPTPADGFVEPEQTTTTFPHLRKTPVKTALVICAILFSTTLFFTFSRGAIYSYALGLAILIIFTLRRRTFRPVLIIIPVTTFFLSLGLQGTFAHFGPTSETFTSAVTKSIHQLSLGIIDLRPQSNSQASGAFEQVVNEGTGASASDADNQAGTGLDVTRREHPESATASLADAADPVFDGYVAESTNVRLNLSSAALATWAKSPQTILFGVGLGGAGIAMHEFDPVSNPSPKEIVQNQPISLLLETGLVGIILLLAALYFSFRPSNHPLWTHPALPLLVAFIVAYLVSMQFFAGLPNALHIYLLPPLFYYLFLPNHNKVLSKPSTLSKTAKNVKTQTSSTKSLSKVQNKHKRY